MGHVESRRRKLFSGLKYPERRPRNYIGPTHEEEKSRLDLFSLTQLGSLEVNKREFSFLGLRVIDLDEHSRALLFVRDLSKNLRVEAVREHPKTLPDAIRAARLARECGELSDGYRVAKLASGPT